MTLSWRESIPTIYFCLSAQGSRSHNRTRSAGYRTPGKFPDRSRSGGTTRIALRNLYTVRRGCSILLPRPSYGWLSCHPAERFSKRYSLLLPAFQDHKIGTSPSLFPSPRIDPLSRSACSGRSSSSSAISGTAALGCCQST